jgi:hypothetical protein
MIILDLSQIISATIYMGEAADCVKHPSKESTDMIKHSIFNSIRFNYVHHKAKYGPKMVLACDSGSWRYDVFPQYKHSRKVKRQADTSGIDWAYVNEVKEELYSDLEKYFPFPLIKLPRVEGDDIIGVLTKHISNQESVSEDIFGNAEKETILIVSSDKDNHQLHALGKHVKQWSPMDKKLVGPKSARESLIEKIVKGDSGDGICNIKMGDNTFVDGIRQKPISEKYLQQFYASKNPVEVCATEEERVNYLRNELLVSYEKIPQDIQDAIILSYNNQMQKRHSKIELMNYLSQNKMVNLLGQVQDFY